MGGAVLDADVTRCPPIAFLEPAPLAVLASRCRKLLLVFCSRSAPLVLGNAPRTFT
jgi:hypothetical protein